MVGLATLAGGFALQSNSAGTRFSPENVATALVVIAAAYLLARAVSFLLAQTADRLTDQRFRVTVLIPVAKFLIYGGAAYVVLRVLFRTNQTQLIAFAGFMGAALGLGLKDLVADVVGGFVVVLEQPFQVGDKVSLDGHYGEIVDIGIRSTTLVTPTDTLVVVPNFALFNQSIANANTSAAEMLVEIEFYVDPDSDVSRARELIEEALVTSPYVQVSEALPVSVVIEDSLYYRTLGGRAYVNDLRNEAAFRTDVTERVLTAFDEACIQSPKVAAGGGEPGVAD